jgi:hypothetical protein
MHDEYVRVFLIEVVELVHARRGKQRRFLDHLDNLDTLDYVGITSTEHCAARTSAVGTLPMTDPRKPL